MEEMIIQQVYHHLALRVMVVQVEVEQIHKGEEAEILLQLVLHKETMVGLLHQVLVVEAVAELALLADQCLPQVMVEMEELV